MAALTTSLSLTCDVNITGRFFGVLQDNDTTGKLMMAAGPLAAGPWRPVGGTAVITPR